MAATVDNFGTRTEFTYDDAGRTLETRTQTKTADGSLAWSVSRSVYDELGRVVASMDRYVEDPVTGQFTQQTQGSVSVYDDAGRMIASERYKGRRIDFDFDRETTFVSEPGTLLSRSTTEYDELGRVVSTTDIRGNVTETVYDEYGRTVANLGPWQTIDGQQVRHNI